MSAILKFWLLTALLPIIVSTSYSNVIPAAIIRRHTVSYKDVPMDSYKPIQHPVVYVPSSMVNLFVHFRSKSSQVHLRQVHKSNPGQVQHTVSEDEPHYLKHEIKKPVIQTIREVIVPYRQVIQEIKPVVEEVKTVVSSGQPKSSVYMNFGQKYTNPSTTDYHNPYKYVMNTNHESTYPYHSQDNAVSQHNSIQSSSYSSNDNQNSLYDLSSIYGIKATDSHLSDYMRPQNIPENNVYESDNNQKGVTSPLIYGLTTDIDTDSGDYGYRINTIRETPAQNNGYEGLVSDYQKGYTLDQSQTPLYRDNNDYGVKGYEQNYNYFEPQYYMTELEPKNNYNSNDYYSDMNINSNYGTQSQDNSNTGYVTQNVVNSGYSDDYSGDLATSDGSALTHSSPVIPILGPFSSAPITKSTTLASLAQLMATLPYQYTYDNNMNMKSNA